MSRHHSAWNEHESRDEQNASKRQFAIPPTGPGERSVGLGDARARGLDHVAEVRSGLPSRASGRRPGAASASASGPRDRGTPGPARSEGKGHVDRLPVGRLSIRQASLSKLEGVWKRLKSHRRFTMATAAINSDQPVDDAPLSVPVRLYYLLWRRARRPSAPSSRRRRGSDCRARSGRGSRRDQPPCGAGPALARGDGSTGKYAVRQNEPSGPRTPVDRTARLRWKLL